MDSVWKLSDQVSEYGDYKFTDEYVKVLKSIGIDLEKHDLDDLDSHMLAQILIEMLMKFDDTLELEILESEYPLLCNWEAQKQGITILLPGYGLFD